MVGSLSVAVIHPSAPKIGLDVLNTGFRRSLAAIVSVAVLVTGMQGAQTAASGADESDAYAVPAQLRSASWFELPPKNRTGAVPRSVVKMAPGARAIWGAEVRAGSERIGDDNPATLIFRGLPESVEIRAAAGVPTHVLDEHKAQVTGCARQGTDVACVIGGSVEPGQSAVAGFEIRSGSAAVGDYYGSVELLEGESSLQATTPLTLVIERNARDALFVTTGAPGPVVAGVPEVRTVHVYNLGGSARRAGRAAVTLKRVVPPKVASRAMGRGQNWQCQNRASVVRQCQWRGRGLGVGESASPLDVVIVTKSAARRTVRAVGGAHTINWVTRVVGKRSTQPSRHLQTLHIAQKTIDKPTPKAKRQPRRGNAIVTAHLMGDAVVGGRANYRVQLNNGGSRPTRGAAVRIRPPSHGRVVKFQRAADWTCARSPRVGAAAVCRYRKAIRSHKGVQPIRFAIQSNKKRAAGKRKHTRVIATWRGKAPRNERRHSVSVRDQWAPALKVKLQTASRRIHTGNSGSVGMLHARVRHLDGRPMVYTWSQVCKKQAKLGKGCGNQAVRWKSLPAGSTQHHILTQGFTPPRVKKPRTLVFQLRATSHGSTVTRRIKVRVVPFKNRWNPRLKTSQWKKSVGKVAPALDRQRRQRVKVPNRFRVRIAGKGPTVASPGQKVRLRVKIKHRNPQRKAPVRKVRWRFDQKAVPAIMKPRVRKKGRVLVFRAPRQAPTNAVVSVIVRHGKGRTTAASELIHVRPRQLAPRISLVKAMNPLNDADGEAGTSGNRPRPTATDTDAAPDGDLPAAPGDSRPDRPSRAPDAGRTATVPGSFCDLYNDAAGNDLDTVTVGTVTVTAGTVTTTGGSCSAANAAINLSGAAFEINGIGLSSVTASVTSTGLSVSGATVALPNGNPDVPGSVTTYSWSDSSDPLTAAFSDGSLAGFTGTIPLSVFPYLPLPKGLALSTNPSTPSELSVTPTTTGYQVSLSAYAVGPNDAALTITGSINTDGSFSLTVTAANLVQLTGIGGSTAVFSGNLTVSKASGQPVAYSGAIAMVTTGGPFQLYGDFSLTSASVCVGYISNGSCVSTSPSAGADFGWNVVADGQAVLSGSNQTFKISGTFTDMYNWTLNATTDYTIQFANGSISNLGGGISMSRSTPTATPQLAIDVTADATIDSVKLAALKLTVTPPVTAHYGIYCNDIAQQPTAKAACQNKTMQLQLDITGTLDLSNFGSTSSIPVHTTVNADPATMDFNLQVAVSGDTGFGPSQLDFSGLEFFATDNPALAPQLQGNPCMTDSTMASQQMVFGATGQIKVGGATFNATVVYNDAAANQQGLAGTCISAFIDQNSASNWVDSDYGQFKSGLSFVYSSWATTLTVNDVETNIAASVPTMVAQYEVPETITKWLWLDSGVDFQAIMTLGSSQSGFAAMSNFNLEINYEFEQSEGFIVGNQGSGTSLKAQTVGFVVNKVNESYAFGADLELVLNTEGSPGATAGETTATKQDVIAPSGAIPMKGSLGFSPADGPAAALITFDFQMGTQNGPMIDNFLGMDGLNVQDLNIMGAFSDGFAGNFIGVAASVQVGASGTTFEEITSFLGLQPNTDISFAFQLSEQSPCFALSIGNPDTTQAQRAKLQANISALQGEIATEQAGANNPSVIAAYQESLNQYQQQMASYVAGEQASTAINWFNVIEAQYVMIYYAPNGCQVATTTQLPSGTSGYAFDFDGAVMGTGVHIAGMFSTGAVGTSGSLDVTVAEQGWSLAGVTAKPLTCEGPGVDSQGDQQDACTQAGQVLPIFDLSFSNAKYEEKLNLEFAGQVNIWGAILISASGDINATVGAQGATVDVSFDAQQHEDLLGIFEEDMTFSFDADWQTPPPCTGQNTPAGCGGDSYFSELDVNATAHAKILVFEGSASFGFDYGPIIIDGTSYTVVTSMYGSFGVEVDLWVVSAGVTASFEYTRPYQCTGSGGTAPPAPGTGLCPPQMNQKVCTDEGDTDCWGGSLGVNVAGTIKYWLFGWHSKTVDLLATTIPIHFQKPTYSPPPAMHYNPPAPPQDTWPNPQWGFSTNMFLNVPWAADELAYAASGGQVGVATVPCTDDPGQLCTPDGTVTAPCPFDGSLQCVAPPSGTHVVNGAVLATVPCPFDASKQCAPSAAAPTDTTSTPNPLYNPQGGARLGQDSSPSQTHSLVSGTMPLMKTPTYQKVVQDFQAAYPRVTKLPANLLNSNQAACSGTTTSGKFTSPTPQWSNSVPASGSNTAFVVADINWKLYLASVVEEASIAGMLGSTPMRAALNYKCGYQNWNNLPDLTDWLAQNSGGSMFNVAYPNSIVDATHEQQLCQAGSGGYPSSDFESACATNLGSLNSDSTAPWGTGWGG